MSKVMITENRIVVSLDAIVEEGDASDFNSLTAEAKTKIHEFVRKEVLPPLERVYGVEVRDVRTEWDWWGDREWEEE